jgi:hypothetical protein
LRTLNPGVPIYGLFCGKRRYEHAALRLGSKSVLRLDGLYWFRSAGSWSRVNGDLALGAWYRDVGYCLAFDVVHLIEWDLLLLDSLERVYASVPEGSVALTAVTPVSLVEHDWEWLQRPEYRREWEQLLSYARATWAYQGTPQACWSTGGCFPRAFLARYAAIDLPRLGREELRLPLFAQILGFQIADTGLHRQWHNRDEDRFFNARGLEIELGAISEELAKPNGRRAFHPVRSVFRGWA